MQTIRLNVDALEVRSFTTTMNNAAESALAPSDVCGSAVSATNGVVICKSCGPCCA